MRKALLVGLCLIASVSFAQKDFSKVQIKVHKVAGSVYMLEGEGGNIGVSVGDDGIVVVDDQFAPLAEKISAALKGITDKPVRFVINTHYHGDHTGGNAIFQQSAPVIAQDNVRKRLQQGGKGGNGGGLSFAVEPSEPKALPIITFDHDVTVHLNGEDIRALHFPSGHTDGDSVIFFPRSNVVHMGDDFVTYGFPFVDIDAGGSVRGMIEALEKIIPQLPPDVKIIPGHGPISNLDDMRKYVKMLRETTATVQTALKQGKSLEQMKQERLLDNWKQWSGSFVSTDTYLETVYNDLTGKKNDKFVQHN